jgi:glycosyltransferase involved in cell wall biosynthesis
MNYLYNCVDAQILLTSNEGWGLSLTEAILTGKPIIANVTGGMQDQMRFEDEKGLWIDFDDQFPSNHRGRYKKCGPWAFPVFPTSISIVGSVPTPYIFDDRCEASDAADRIFEVYNLGPDKRKAIGLVGREWAIGDEAKFTSEKMTYSIISNLDKLFQTWKPRKKYELIKVENKKPKIVPHNLIY